MIDNSKAVRGQQQHQGRKPEHVPVLQRSILEIVPAPENDALYRPITEDDPEIQGLVESIRQHGIKEPLIITEDGYIISGHRRFFAAKLAGLKAVPVRVETIRYNTHKDRFLLLLRECNRQREKSFDEKLRETVVSMNPEEAYASLIEHRKIQSEVKVKGRDLAPTRRHEISSAKQALLDAVNRVLLELEDYWPVSERTIHYHLLNAPPLIHSSKPGSLYRNDKASYKALTDICTRGRVAGLIPFEAIGDETRPLTHATTHRSVAMFMQQQIGGFLKGYWRDLIQSQPNHIEILCEKNTAANFLKTVAMEYCIPLLSMRGQASLAPRWELVQRFKQSGKEDLILLVMSDFDPSGEAIVQAVGESMLRDFHLPAQRVHVIKAGLTYQQTQEMQLPSDVAAKKDDPSFKRFVQRYGTDVYELEALSVDDMQRLLREAIDGVLDTKAFNAELDAEKNDALRLESIRRAAKPLLMKMAAD